MATYLDEQTEHSAAAPPPSAPSAPPAHAPTEPRPHRLTVARYEAMLTAGLVGESDAVELLDGLIVDKMSINPPHAYLTKVLYDLIYQRIAGDELVINAQAPFQLSETSRPEPDLYVARGEIQHFRDRLPKAEEIIWVAEVADTSIGVDRGRKLALYAAAGIPAYWVVDINTSRVECYADPAADGTYGTKRTYGVGDAIEDERLGRVEVAALFG